MDERDTLPETTAQALALVSAMPGELRDKLAAYRAHSGRLDPTTAAAYDRLVAHLASIYTGQVGPAVGAAMPDFLLSNENGELVSLERFLERGPLVISINRGHWCPYCKLDLRALAAITPDIRRFGAQVISIMPETAHFTKQAIGNNALPFPILSDVDLGYALSLGLVYWVGAEVKQLYDRLGLDLERFQGHPGFFLPLAAKFIVGRDGLVKARQVDIDYRQRMDPAAILDALAKL
ncbi:MAG: AhpC/TSA family protein [Proteobacteria bacterium]|nr:AhpC/TSA family protein [Pseudomonadota bacterium]